MSKIYVCFELTMPNRGSWNNKWSQENDRHYIIKDFCKTYFDEHKNNLVGSWWYTWSDGWSACVTGEVIDGKESAKRKRMKTKFCGYDWMVNSIIYYGKIMTDTEIKEYLKELKGE